MNMISKRSWLSFGLAVLVLTMTAAACTDTEGIEDANEAARTDQLDSDATGDTNVFDLHRGDCLGEVLDIDTEESELKTVSCGSATATGRVTSLFLVDRTDGDYPGEAYFDDQMAARCDAEASYFLFPTPESWEYGDRTIICIEEY